MKIFLTSMLLLQCLLNEANANLNGQTNERIPLLKEDGTSTGTTITCSAYSVEDETNDVEYVKYVLDTEEEETSTVVWNSQPTKTLFEQCASYAAEQNAGMFYFDGETCETSDSVYERKEKTCNSIAAKIVYMQKGQPNVQPDSSNCTEGSESYSDGQVWDAELPCAMAGGRKRCQNGVIIPERMFFDTDINDDSYTPHVEGVDYFPLKNSYVPAIDSCLIKPPLYTGKAGKDDLEQQCSYNGGDMCGYNTAGYNSTAFTEDVKAFLDSPVVNSMETSELTMAIFRAS